MASAANAEGSDTTFGLSAPTDKIDEFLSHSWSSGHGVLKWLNLCLMHNATSAVVNSIFVGALAVLLESTGTVTFLPTVRHPWFDGHVRGVTFGPYLMAYGAFLLTFMFRSLYRRNDPTMFLDKCCINQLDPVQKQSGIAAINEFLRRSSKMLVCYTSEPSPGKGYFEVSHFSLCGTLLCPVPLTLHRTLLCLPPLQSIPAPLVRLRARSLREQGTRRWEIRFELNSGHHAAESPGVSPCFTAWASHGSYLRVCEPIDQRPPDQLR